MRQKAIKDLNQKSDDDFFREVATGLDSIAQNAVELEGEARFLWENRRARGFRVVRALASEEGAKFLILLDAVRCPRRPPETFSRQLGRFNDHLSKGLYVESLDWEPATFGDFQSWIDRERREFYLDGPNDVDWIFPNEILHTRERTFYIDYAQTDEGHIWLHPLQADPMLGFPYHEPRPLQLVRSLHGLGFANAAALRVIAEIWRPVRMTPDFHRRDIQHLNRRTLEALQAKGLSAEAPARNTVSVIDRWLFPLWSVDLTAIKVDQADLRAVRDDRWYREMGVSWEG